VAGNSDFYEEPSGGMMGRLIRHPYLTALAVLAVGGIICYALFSTVNRLENNRLRDNFQLVVLKHHSLLERTIQNSISPLATLQAFYRSSDSVYRDEFSSFVEPLLAQHAEIESLQWIPRVTLAQESAYERTARREGIVGFEMQVWSDPKGDEKAGDDATRFPIYVVEPIDENADLLGIDLASHPGLQEALVWSRDQDAVAATQMIMLNHRPDAGAVTFVLMPVYQSDSSPGTVRERRDQFRGYVAATYRVEDIISQTLSSQDKEQFDIFVYDMMAPARERLFYRTGASDGVVASKIESDEEVGNADLITHSAVLNLADRLWSVRYLPSESFLRSQSTDRAITVFVAGVLMSLLLALGAIFSLRHSARIRKVTVQLQTAMDKFENDMFERRKAEESLRSSEALYRSTIDAMSDIIIVVDADLRITLVNRELVERFRDMGLPTDFIGRSMTEAFPFVSQETEQLYHRIFENGEIETATECYPVGGIEFLVELQRIPVLENGKVVRIITAARDMTERKKTEHDLRLTQFAVDKAVDAAYWMGPDARFIYVNDAACRSLGYTKEELLTMTVHDIDPNFPKEAWSKHWKDLEQFRSFTIKSTHRTKDGKTFPVEIALNLVEFEGRKYNFAYARDISEAGQVHSEPETSLCSFPNYADNTSHGIAVISPRFKLLYMNRQLKEWYPGVDLPLGPACFELFNDSEPGEQCADCPTRKTLRDGGTHRTFVRRVVADNVCTFRITSSPIRDKKNEIIAIVEMIEDCTVGIPQLSDDCTTNDHRLAGSQSTPG
jgi:PAS domain S-box-containing protein